MMSENQHFVFPMMKLTKVAINILLVIKFDYHRVRMETVINLMAFI